jgi:hypothetical protein
VGVCAAVSILIIARSFQPDQQHHRLCWLHPHQERRTPSSMLPVNFVSLRACICLAYVASRTCRCMARDMVTMSGAALPL